MVFLCVLGVLCGESAFDRSLLSRRERRSYGEGGGYLINRMVNG
ncbi:MAG: hypothetical protein ACJAUN_001687 [Alcanivorax sp.]|jgi:hypothetical protein